MLPAARQQTWLDWQK